MTADQLKERLQIFGRKMSRSAATNKQRGDFLATGEVTAIVIQFAAQHFQILRDQVIPIGHQREVTITTVMQTKRHMNVQRLRRRLRFEV
jgi:hypothetical protein